MDQLFEQSFIRPRGLMGATEEEAAFAPMDVCETDQGYEVYMAVPGVKPDDIDLTVQQNILTVRGRYCSPMEESYSREGPARYMHSQSSRGASANRLRTTFVRLAHAVSLLRQ